MNDFQIGTSQAGMVTLKSLGLVEPLSEYQAYSQAIDTADGAQQGEGWPLASWRWAFITLGARYSLKTYCPGRSALVYIRTLDDTKTAIDARAIVIWPEKETRSASKVLEFTLQFRILEILEPLE